MPGHEIPEGELVTDPDPVTETVSVYPPATGVTTAHGAVLEASEPEVPVRVKLPVPGQTEAGAPEDAVTVKVDVTVEFDGGVTGFGENE